MAHRNTRTRTRPTKRASLLTLALGYSRGHPYYTAAFALVTLAACCGLDDVARHLSIAGPLAFAEHALLKLWYGE